MSKEIERKWIVETPTEKLDSLESISEFYCIRHYLATGGDQEIRLTKIMDKYRNNTFSPAGSMYKTPYWLTIKTGKGLQREEIEFALNVKNYEELVKLLPENTEIQKLCHFYKLHNGLTLEYNLVDPVNPPYVKHSFSYCEVEFPNLTMAKKFKFPDGLFEHVAEVTGMKYFSMKEYWNRTRL